MTALTPPPERVYAVRAVIPGDPAQADPPTLEKALRSKAAEGLRQRCSELTVTVISEAPAEMTEVEVTATVNEWNAGAAGMRIATLLIIKAGPGFDATMMSVTAEPVRPRPDSTEQAQTSTNAPKSE